MSTAWKCSHSGLLKLLKLFEKDLFKIIEKIKVRKINCEFQDKLNSNIKDITSSRETLVPADETSNFYKLTKEKYEQLLHNSITKTYNKANSSITKTINEQGKKIANKKNILDRNQVNDKEECFLTLKEKFLKIMQRQDSPIQRKMK